MADNSTKPYLIRAIYEWCIDNAYTPYLSVVVNGRTRVPMEYVKDGQIVLNLSPNATQGMLMDNEWVSFSARFNGASRQLDIPITAIVGIFARENGEGLGFDVTQNGDDAEFGIREDSTPDDEPPTSPKPIGKPKLQVVK